MAERKCDSHIASFEVKDNPEAFAEEHVTLAFDRLAQPVLVEKMKRTDNVDLVRNALDAACRQYTTPLAIVNAVAAEAVETLGDLVTFSDDIVRAGATRACELLAKNPTGRERIVSSGVLAKWAKVLQDPLVEARLQIFGALKSVASVSDGAGALVEAGYVVLLRDKAATDPEEEVQEAALLVLSKCIDGPEGKGLAAALEGSACMNVAIALLEHGSEGVRQRAANCVHMMATSTIGKKQAIEGGAVTLLNALAEDLSADVRAAAAGALMVIVVDNSGKEALLAEGMEGLVTLLNDTSFLTKLNTMRAVSAVAAHPKARAALLKLEVLKRLRAIRDEGNTALARSAETAIRCCEWTP